MKPDALRDWIDSLTDDIEFQYKGLWGVICPFTRSEISLCYNGHELTVDSVEKAMSTPFIAGHSLNELSTEIQLG